MNENTNYEFKLKILSIELFNLQVSSTAASGKVIAAGTIFAVGLLLVLGAFSDKLVTLVQYFLK